MSVPPAKQSRSSTLERTSGPDTGVLVDARSLEVVDDDLIASKGK